MEFKIQRVEEFEISQQEHLLINGLLNKTFGDYHKEQSYYKQLPSFRYLVWQEDRLIGHMAVEHRNINIGQMLSRIFGVADLCVDHDFQSQHIASSILKQLEVLGKKHQVDFIVLIAQNHEVYEKNGFSLVNNTCRWLMIDSNQTLGVGHRRIEQCLMMKPINDKQWREGLIDFLGHIF